MRRGGAPLSASRDLRVGFDAHHLAQPHTGNGVHTAGLLRALRALEPELGLRIFAYGRASAGSPAVDRVTGGRLRRFLVDYARHAAADAVDVLHTQYSAPLACRARVCMTIHDAAFTRPGTADFSRTRIAAWSYQARRAAAVITVSHAAADDLARSLRLPPGHIHVVPNGVARVEPTPADREAIAARLAGAEPPLVAYVGRLTRRKRVPLLLQGFEMFRRRRGGTLVVAGPAAGDDEALAVAGRAPGVVALGEIGEGEKWALLERTQAFAFLSEYEGFGLPVLEAMAASVPVVISAAAALLEVTRGHAVVTEPNPAAVAEALELATGPAGAGLAREAAVVAAACTWEEAARQTAAVYRIAAAE